MACSKCGGAGHTARTCKVKKGGGAKEKKATSGAELATSGAFVRSASGMALLNFSIVGTTPLLFHSSKARDPLIAWKFKEYKDLISKGEKRRTLEEEERLAYLSWMIAMHADEEGPYVPGVMFELSIIKSSRQRSLGPKFEAGVRCISLINRLDYTGPRDLDKLYKYKDKQFVDRRLVNTTGSGAAVMATRPIFHEWSTTCSLAVDTSIVDAEVVVDRMVWAGILVGIGSYRSKYGKFNAEVL